jgi:putative transposase
MGKYPEIELEDLNRSLLQRGRSALVDLKRKIIAMYAQGMSVREIKRFLEEQYKVEVSSDLISTVTDSVIEDVLEWQSRPLESMYPVIFFDALRVKIRDEGSVRNKAVYLALGIQRDGTKDVLGLWIQQSEGAKFWLGVMNELKNRGIQDILIAVIDGFVVTPMIVAPACRASRTPSIVRRFRPVWLNAKTVSSDESNLV